MEISKSELTDKQRLFVHEYLVDLNATQAAIRAGYGESTARQVGSRMLTNVDIAEAIKKGMAKREKRTEITQDMVLKELAKIGFADIRKAVKWGTLQFVPDPAENPSGEVTLTNQIALVSSGELDDDTACAISEVSQTSQGIKIKMHDKRAALVDMARHLGMFVDKSEVTVKHLTEMNDAQLDHALEAQKKAMEKAGIPLH